MIPGVARWCAAVFVITLAVWAAGARGPYHFDDAITPVGDPASQSLSAWTAHAATTLRPLTKLTYALEPDSAPVRRLVTIGVHAAAAVLLLLLLCAFDIAPVFAALLALVWSLHPVHAEAVLAVAGRPAALANAAVLGALLAAKRGRDVTASVLLVCAILARETALGAVLPILVVSRRRWLVIGAALLAAAWIAWTPRYQELADFSYREMHPVSACAAQIAAIPIGLALYLRPWALSIDHGPVAPGIATAVGIAIYVAAAAGLVIAWRRRATLSAVGIALWLAAIAPTQSIVPKLDALTERPLSLALAGIVIALAPLVRVRWLPALLAAALAVATVVRGQLYVSDVRLWAATVETSPDAVRAHWNYAQALLTADRPEEARQELLRAQALAPYDVRIEAALEKLRFEGGR